MPTKNEDLHGNVPDKAAVALILIDVINAMEFEGGEALAEQTFAIMGNIARLRRDAKEAGVPVIYVNDNFGRWRSDFSALVTSILERDARGKPLAQLLRPEANDYFVLKPKHSGFYSTTLAILLEYLGATTLVLAGVAGNICVLFTAHDAFMRDFHLFVPQDCTASNTPEDNEYALHQMRTILGADTRPAEAIDWQALLRTELR